MTMYCTGRVNSISFAYFYVFLELDERAMKFCQNSARGFKYKILKDKKFQKITSVALYRNLMLIIFWKMLNQKYNIAMFGSFSHLQEFLKKQGLLFEADLCDLLNEVFHLAYTHFFKKHHRFLEEKSERILL